MVSKERIEEEGLTQSEVMDKMTAEPKRSVEILPEWEEYPEEAPGEDIRIEDDVLIYERDGFEARLESYETTHWRAEIDLPDRVGKWFPRAVDLKVKNPDRGFVQDVEIEDYTAKTVAVVVSEFHQPTWEVNNFIDDLDEYAEESEQFQQDMEEKLSVASEVEERQKEARDPGWSEDEEAFVCPHCKETSTHVKRRDDGGADCIHCGESIDDYVKTGGED